MLLRSKLGAGVATLALAGALFAANLMVSASHAGEPRKVPPPAADESAAGGPQVAVVAGGCFWGVQGVFQHVKGVTSAVSGYDGGEKATAHYEMTSEGDTGHAESVRVTFDPSRISYGQILQI
jgi:peptide-methionine (S)-S-oxide reductase